MHLQGANHAAHVVGVQAGRGPGVHSREPGVQREVAVAPGRGLEHADTLGQNFLADSVPRNERDLVLGHAFPLLGRNDVY